MMKLFAGTLAKCSMFVLRPQETPSHQDSIVWSPVSGTIRDVKCMRGMMGHYHADSGRPGHTNGTEYAL